jgi:hypothetical protein
MTSAASASVCTGGTVNIPLTSSIPSTYTWFAWSNANVSGESTTPQSTGTLSNTLTLTTASTQIVNYAVTPTSTGGCTGASQAVAVTVNLLPTITLASTAAARCYSASAQNSTLSYSAVTQSPTHYTITWNAAAQTAGFVNVTSTVLPAGTITFPVPAGVAAGTYTGTVRVTNANGCSSTGNNFTVTIGTAPIISTQPTNQTVCSGSSVSFSIAATGVALTYQWRKGTTNLCNCGTISGVNTNTLTINPVAVGNAATDYNCVVTSGACPGVISNYVSFTVNTAVAVPSAQATDLIFPAVGITSIIGTFTKSSSASHYLVVRTPTASAPTNPTNGTTYTQGTSALGGYIQYAGTGNVFTATGLSQGTTYYFWVFAYNSSSCGTSPLYRTGSPLNGNATTATNVSCGTVTTLYWGGAGSVLSGATSGTDFNTASNWSTSNSSYVASPVAPSQCNTVSMAINSNSTLTLSADASVYNLTYTVTGNNRSTRLSTEGYTLTVNGDAVVDVAGGNQNTAIYIGENSGGSGVVDFKANFKIGETYYSGGFFTAIPQSYLIGNINSKIIFRGDVLFGRTARVVQPAGGSYPPPNPVPVPGIGTTPGTIEFDGPGLQQVLWNNNYYYDNFYNIVVGNQNSPYVKHVTGTYTPDNIFNNFTINDGCTVDLGTSQWIREYQGGTLTMNGTARLILGNDKSVLSSYSTGVTVAGSNFPGGFSTMNISPSSTIEYNGGSSITQTVLGVPAVGSLTYGNLVLSNTDGLGTANKISTSVITVAGNTSINNKTNFTLGANLVSGGNTTVNNEGSMDCNTRVVSGTGSFTLSGGGTLSLGSPAGITVSGAAGNIQTSSRSFSTAGNYVYNGTTAQATGNGLPKTVNNLTISNTAGVTLFAASANYSVAGTLGLAAGAFAINGDTLTINSIQRTSGTLTGSSTSSIGITGSSVPLFFTGGGRTLKHLFLTSSASADLQTTLDITAGSNAGSVAVASGATLNTYGYLTLKSDANGTARVAEIPVDGSGNALGTISGNVQIERYIPAKRGWRMLTLPVSASGAPTINDALQEGAVNTSLAYVNNQNPNPGYGIHISGSSPSLGFDATPLNNPSMLRFTRTTGLWSGIPNTLTSTVRDQEGYMVFIRGNRSVNLNLNTGAALSNTVIRVMGGLRMGRQTINLPGGAGNYSVAGNPFASTIDFRSISTTGAASSSTFVLWDPALTGSFGVGAYQYFTQSGGPGSDYTVFPGGGSYGSAGSVSNHIQAGQAFMVQHSGAGTVVINENAKVSSSTSTVFRPMPNNTTGRISTLLSAVEADSSTTLLDGALVLYSHLFSDSLDVEDAKKLMNNSENFGISTGTSIYQIEKRRTINDTDTIQYDIRSMKIKKYQLAVEVQHLEEAGTSAFLEDSYTRTVTALDFNATTVYPFSVTADAASKAVNRFKIYFKQLTVLPVTFTSVKAYRKNKTIDVEWKVTAQTNISSYEVERSADGILFTNQYSLPAAMGNNSHNSYQWTDEEPLTGLNFFRIKSLESNGRATYSNIAKVYFSKDQSPITVFPNPVTDGKVNISFAAHQPGIYTARLFNSAGQLIQSANVQPAATNGNAVIHFDKNITRGNYVLEIVQPDNTTAHIKLIY